MPHPQRTNGQAPSSSSSKPLTPHPSLPVNPMTYQPSPSISPITPSSATINYQYPNMSYAYAPTGVPIPTYLMYGQPPQQGMMMMVPPPQGHFNPTMALRQSLFQTPVYGYIPTSTAEGYSYSSTYLQQQQQQQQQQQKTSQLTQVQQPQQQAVPGPSIEPDSRPAKRPRRNSGTTSSTSTKPTHSTTSTTTSTTPTTYLPTRTKLPLKKGQTEESSQGHWRNCSESGCHYVGPDREVRVHEEDRHLYVKGQKRGAGAAEGGHKGKEEEDGDEEEEERARRAISGPKMAIPGTSITLETPEDIARWIAERKARWPTAERVANKEKERKEKIERGEIDPNERGRHGRGGGRGGRGGGDRDRGRGRERGGRGRGRGGTAAVRGRDNGYGVRGGEAAGVAVKPEAAINHDDADGSDGTSDGSTSSSSDDEDDNDDSSFSSAPETNPVHTRTAPLPTPQSTGKQTETCRAFVRMGKCKFGSRCRYDHPTRKVGDQKNAPRPGKDGNKDDTGKVGQGSVSTGRLSNPFARPSLLDAMLKDPLQQTLLTLTESIDFIVDNGFFDGVELVPGQAKEELERRRRADARIEVLEEDKGLIK